MEEEKKEIATAQGLLARIEGFVKGDDMDVWFKQCDLAARRGRPLGIVARKLEGDKVTWVYSYADKSKLAVSSDGSFQLGDPKEDKPAEKVEEVKEEDVIEEDKTVEE